MSISSNSLQVLSSLSLIPSSMSQALSASATPAQLNQIASLNSQLGEEELLYGQPSTASLSSMSAGTSPDVADFVDLSNATLATLGGTPATTTTPATAPATTAAPATLASPGFSVLG